MGDLNDLLRSVIRIPVAGPKPNNTLVFVRGFIPQPEFIDDTELVSAWIEFDTLYRIDGFQQSNAAEYRDNTRISITAYIENLAATNDGDFVCAVDEVEAYIASDGTLKGRALIAELDEVDVELTMGFYFSAWVLTYEPPAAEFPVRHRWSLAEAVRTQDRISHAPPPDDDRARTVGDGRRAAVPANRLAFEQSIAERALRRSQQPPPAVGNPQRPRGGDRGGEEGKKDR